MGQSSMFLTFHTICNWASEASPTLGCSIEISCDIYNICDRIAKTGLITGVRTNYSYSPFSSAK